MSVKAALDWYKDLSVETAEEIKVDYALAISRALEAAGMTRSEFARRLNKSPAWVTTVLRGDRNLTIETMQELADALDSRVHIHVAKKSAKCRWFEVHHTTGAETIQSFNDLRIESPATYSKAA